MIYEKIFCNARFEPDKTALIQGKQVISYGELVQAIVNRADRYRQSGMAVDERVMFLLPNGIEFIVSYFAVLLVGAVPVLVDPKLRGELAGIIVTNTISTIMVTRQDEQRINWLWADLLSRDRMSADVRMKLWIEGNQPNDGKSGSGQPGCQQKKAQTLFPKSGAGSLNEGDMTCAPGKTALILYTSGSSGEPKGVINSHVTLQQAAHNYTHTLSIRSDDLLMGVIPFYHSYGFGSCMLAGLFQGAAILLCDTFVPGRILDAMASEKPTIFHGVPFMFDLLADHYNPKKHCLDSIKYCISAGAPLTYEIARKFKERTGQVIHQEYGSSETGTIALNLSFDVKHNCQSVGVPLTGVNVKIKTDGREAQGEILVQSKGHSLGYVCGQQFLQTWHPTGDIGWINESGEIFVTGRAKRMINFGGLKVNPVEIETCLLTHPKITDAHVKAVDQDDFNECAAAYIVRSDKALKEDEVITYCQDHLALYKVPRIVKWIDAIPRTSLGKVRL